MYAVSYGLHFFAFINYVYIFGLSNGPDKKERAKTQ